ncbi:MAG TPA: DUF6580 family putative transport protein [Candidatus Eisenbacteria bacterium]|nr:DUF6580 family putative transport protein [Candidatus Eisenbacteria bacterium]
MMLSEKSSAPAFALRAAVAATMILVAAAVRVAPHPWNFTPIGAMALFSGAIFRDRRIAFLFPLAAIFAGDLFVGLHRLIPVVYASVLVSVLIGTWFSTRRTVFRIGFGVFLGALQFFLITNFAVWRVFDTYPHTLAGLGACYVAGLPYFGNALAGDALYAAVLFGGFALAEKLWPAMRTPADTLAH